MAKVTPAQTNFNGGEISRRLQTRFDLNLYDIALAECVGWVPLAEGVLDACPGFLRVAAAAGPCRLVPFEYSATQGYVIEMSGAAGGGGAARFYTNDARIEDDDGDPIELELPYDLATIGALSFEQSYDVLYLFHGAHRPRELARVEADAFELSPLDLLNGPFETRNKDQGLTVSASGVSGSVTLTSSAPLFEAGDVGGLFQLEADDFGDISSWEPGITVTVGQLLTWNERVYRVAGGSGRTGTVAPVHNAGVEWDGIGTGTNVNDDPAGGVQLEYIHDRFGQLRITAFTDATHATADVIRRLPFTAATSYDYEGGYYDPDSGEYVQPSGAVEYNFGTWRWRFGAFSDRRGWPTCGVVWRNRLVLAKGQYIYASVAGDLNDHSVRNELGDISNDEAFVEAVPDTNPILDLVADKNLLIFSASGMFALGPDNAAQGVGPLNKRIDQQNNEGAAAVPVVVLDGRALYVGKSRRRIIEGAYALQRDRQDALDLTRYARHIGTPRFTGLASAKDPNRLVWASRGDGTLAVAAYVPEEQTLGWARRPLCDGAAARSIATISDPLGELNQLWAAIEFGGGWHVCRMDQFRQEGDDTDPVMVDMAAEYDGAPATHFGPTPWLAGRAVQVEADERFMTVTLDDTGSFTLPTASSRVRWGMPFAASFTTLPPSGGSENGPALGKMRRISRLVLDVLNARGLAITVQGVGPRDIEQLMTDSTTDDGFAADSGVAMIEDAGEFDRLGQVTVTRVAPFAATVRAVQPTVDVGQR